MHTALQRHSKKQRPLRGEYSHQRQGAGSQPYRTGRMLQVVRFSMGFEKYIVIKFLDSSDLECERKRGIKYHSTFSGLNNSKNGFAFL